LCVLCAGHRAAHLSRISCRTTIERRNTVRDRLQGVRRARARPAAPAPLAAQRRVSSRGGIQAARQRIQLGLSHAGQTVIIQLAETTVRVIDQHGDLITTVPRNGTSEISRLKAYGTRRSR
jgi:hypothetical protein